eukprot:TRINITY_DN64_c0_g1_i1.p1 TRINITY_DN64_c0_g1~~TRINITY_DN64_c0_g1_i1.p1  ORF type:complete len:497 (+),score=150.26 TRINITY_DN64_c0_g1_i1:242-1732(+)
MEGRQVRMLVALLFLGLAGSVLGDDVLTLDVDSIDDALATHDFLVIEFYAPWCGHCKKLTPEYERAAGVLKTNDPPIALAKVDVDEEKNKPLASKYGIKGFPTLKIFRKGAEAQEYQGPREADGIVSYLKKQAGPSSVELTTSNQATEFFEENPVAVVGIFASLDSDDFKEFLAAANSLRADHVFAHTVDASLLPVKSKPVSVPSIRLFKNFDEEFNDLEKFDLQSVSSFVSTKTIPLVVEMSKDASNRNHLMAVFGSDLPKLLAFWDYSTDSSKAIKDAVKAAASKFEKVKFVIGDAEENDNALKYFGVEMEEVPVLIMHDTKAEKKYIKENAKAEDVDKFIQDYEAGSLAPKVKSEEIPEENNEPVKVVVGKNFDDIVFKSGKNVFIEFYAPWCGHCKSLAPVFDELAAGFENDPDVIIAKMDATANDIPSSEFQVKGFPTLYFRAADGTISQYNGDRSKEDLEKFVNTQRTPVTHTQQPPESGASAAEGKDEL